jgi:hypothetical protein
LRRFVIRVRQPHHDMSSDRHIAYPPCTGTNYQSSVVSRQICIWQPIAEHQNLSPAQVSCTCASTLVLSGPIQTSLSLGRRDAHHKPRPRIIIHLNTRIFGQFRAGG